MNPNDAILEKIKDLNFDYYQLYDVDPESTKTIKFKYNMHTIINKINKNINLSIFIASKS